jgi:hypothetical protein
MDLVQETMIVIEYATKFIHLSRFAIYLILDEEKKAKKFERGLSPRIKTMMTCFDCNDPPPMTQYCPLLAPHIRLPWRSPILGLLSQRLT